MPDGKLESPRVRHMDGAPVFWAYMDGPGRTFAGDVGDVADLMGRTPAGVRGSGATWADGPHGDGLAFDGTSAAPANFAASLTLPGGSFTLSVWVDRSNAGTIFETNSAQTGFTVVDFGGFATSGHLSLYQSNWRSFGSIPSGRLCHVAVSLDGVSGVATAYLDGSPIGSLTSCQPVPTMTGLRIGAQLGGWGPLQGRIGSIALFGRVLSPAEIAREHADPDWRLRSRRSPAYFATPAGPSAPIFRRIPGPGRTGSRRVG